VAAADQSGADQSGADQSGADQSGADQASWLGAGRLAAGLAASTDVMARLASQPDLSTPIPTCPEWTMRELCVHVGRAHRWGAAITSQRAQQPLPFREVPDGKFPADPDGRGEWLRAGAQLLTKVVAEAGSDPVWTFNGPQPSLFWLRRMAHETAVHRADADIATGQATELDPDVAADGVDEWLLDMSSISWEGEDQRLAALPEGKSIHVHVTDPGVTGEWTVRSEPGVITAERGHAKADVALRGPATSLLLILQRRMPPTDPSAEILGDAAVLDSWLDVVRF
jgi:uncharacterized protein (TIGR03083 family)